MSIVEHKQCINRAKNNDKTALLERLLLKIDYKIDNMVDRVDKMIIQKTKLKKGGISQSGRFRVPVAQLDRAAAF